MAYVARQLSDEETKNKTAINLSDGAAGSSGGASVGTEGPGTAPEASSGTFVGIGDYLRANAGGAAQLGQQVSGLINNTVGAATNTINQGAQQFAQAAQGAQNVYNQQAVNDTINQGAATSDFSKLATGAYGGPNTLADIGAQSQIDSAINKANQQAQLAGSTGGRAELLREVLARPSTLGSSNLNSALLNGSEAGSQAVTAAAKNVDPLTGLVQNAQQNAAYTASQAAANNRNVAQQSIGAIGGYLGQQNEAQAQALAQLQAQQTQKAQNARDYLAYLSNVSNITPQPNGSAREGKQMLNPLNQLTYAPGANENPGLTGEQANALYALAQNNARAGGAPVDLTQYYTAPDVSGLTRANVITPQEAARLNGLAAIAGTAGYTSSQQNLDGTMNYGGAYNTLQSSMQNAQAQQAANAARIAAEQEAAAAAARQAEADRLAQEQANAAANKNKMDPISGAISKVNPILGKVTNSVTKTVKKLTKCVMATALVENGTWEEEKRNVLVDWCERTLHNNPVGEALRRGYQVICSKFTVPSVRSGGKLAPYFTWSFEQATGLLGKGVYKWYSVPNTVVWVSAMVITGAFVTKGYATKCWTSLYDKK